MNENQTNPSIIIEECNPISDLGENIKMALNNARSLTNSFGGRELSLVITKLQEAYLWLSEIVSRDPEGFSKESHR